MSTPSTELHPNNNERAILKNVLQSSSDARSRFALTAGVACFGCALMLLVEGCRGRRDVREWRPTDHDEEGALTGAQVPMASNSGRNDDGGRALVEAAWMTKCSVCHGRGGAGDGPNGAMVKAADLTASQFLDKVTDEDLVKSIGKGKNKMPAFPDLPPSVVAGLVKRIRALRAP
ncbi:MAG: hypothetical protein NVS3B20_09730 [Polyangiales bacterium]